MDWKQLLQDLFSSGMTQSRIADELDKSQAWVSACATGKYDDLKWSDGQALIALHSRVCGTERKAA